MIQDFKGRTYNLIEVDNKTTLLECTETHDRVRIASFGWDKIGFVKS